VRGLITGLNGFVGGHLAEHLLRQGWQISGIALTAELSLPLLRGRVDLLQANLLDRQAVQKALEHAQPDVIFHLAAQAHVPTALSDPVTTITNNLLGQLHLLEALRTLARNPITVVACTSEEYGAVKPEEIPVGEQVPLRPNNPYAFSKVAQDMLALQHFLGYGTRTVRLRLFNHIGPRQGDAFVVGAFAHQIARIEAGRQEPVVRVGNLEARRDFTDVRDIVRAYELAALRGEPGEVYNVGTGQAVAIDDVLHTLIGLSTAGIQIQPDPERMRPVDVPVIACDAARFRARTGWAPAIPLERTLADILDDWREQVTLNRI
jgi:GDP-4-dehydro-6-deoxy-D-mannose reductase